MLGLCHSIGCTNPIHSTNDDFCEACSALNSANKGTSLKASHFSPDRGEESMSEKYPKYYKSVGNLTEVDVYAIHQLFNVQDPSGAIHHASKKLLLSGVRTVGKSQYDDIREARDTLTRWLQLNHATQ